MTFKKLLTTTAVVAMTASGAYIVSPMPYAAAATMAAGYVQNADADDHYASNLIGSTVYSSANEDGEAIGDVNDLVLSADGSVDAVVIGVGGFLGLGEKNVAVTYDKLTWKTDENGEAWPVLAATQEELEAAPAFERHDEMAMNHDEMAAKQGDEMARDDQMPRNDEIARDDEMPRNDEMAMNDDPAMAADDANRTGVAATDQQLQAYDPSLVSADNLIDTTVYSSDGENVGEVSDVLLSDGGEIDAIVIDVGGFLGIGEKPVAIDFKDLRIAVDEDQDLILQTAFTRDQLDAAPEYDETAYRTDREKVIVRTKS